MTKTIQPSPYRSITTIKCPLNKHIPPLLSLKISKPKPNFINNLNQFHSITIPNKYSKPIKYKILPTSKSAFLSPIILFAIQNNLLYNSKSNTYSIVKQTTTNYVTTTTTKLFGKHLT